MIRSTAVLVFLLAGVTLPAASARAEDAGGPAPKWLTFGAEGVASIATDDPGYFNDTSYGRSAMRLARLRLDVALRLGGRAAVLAEGRADNGEGLTVAVSARSRSGRSTSRPAAFLPSSAPPRAATTARTTPSSDRPSCTST